MVDAMKSLDARTTFQINDNGTLTETGGDSLQFTRSAIDVEIMLELLRRNEEKIHHGANLERGKIFGKDFREGDFIDHSV